ncbi:hypothetical protein EI94DRAFT_1646523 [Lactarius quietus]|nr:hypothetical protein EI94DRAFT_1646523 [Lactarius quietus]
MLEDIGGLVDAEDLPEEEGRSDADRDISNNVHGNNELDLNEGLADEADYATPPNGLCLSITKSKHIHSVKDHWQ